MNTSVKAVTLLLGAAVLAATAVSAPASAQQRRIHEPHYNSNHEIRALPDCADPGSHLGCPAAPVHDNTPPPA
jgi:hypothetical protein